MFFVLSGHPLFRNQHGKEELAPGDFVFCPEGRAGLHTFSNPTEEPARILAISAGASRTSSPTRTWICMGGDSRSRSRATRERRRPRHHRSLRDSDRVIARPDRRSPEAKGPRESASSLTRLDRGQSTTSSSARPRLRCRGGGLLPVQLRQQGGSAAAGSARTGHRASGVRMWGIDADEPHRDALAAGDLVLVYLAAPEREFIGRASLPQRFMIGRRPRQGFPGDSRAGCCWLRSRNGIRPCR